jgi:hypothetical protein
MLHIPNCNCPRCRSAAAFAADAPTPEQRELEQALELLSVQTDRELEQFLGDMIGGIGRGLRAAGSFAANNIVPVLGPALKQIAKSALPIAGGALGSLIPLPGVGTALGSALGGVVANALESETAALSAEVSDLERARRFIAIARDAIRDSALAHDSRSPEAAARAALAKAVATHLPSAASAAATVLAKVTPESSTPATEQSGTWHRHGTHIVVMGA